MPPQKIPIWDSGIGAIPAVTYKLGEHIKNLIIIALAVLFGIIIYGFGYYRGYQDHSRIASCFDLSLHEDIYEGLKSGSLDLPKKYIVFLIGADAKNIELIDRNSLQDFWFELNHSRSPHNTTHILQKADEILTEDASKI